MKLSKLAAALVTTVALSVGGSAYAVPSITNVDGTLMPWGGFDWHGSAAAWTTGFGAGAVGTNFTIQYAAWATGLNQLGSGTLATPGLDNNANGVMDLGKTYEYTTFNTLQATVTSNSGGAFPVITYSINGGTFAIYYDTTPDANAPTGAWTGFQDGIKIIGGTYDAGQPGAFLGFLGTNSIGLTGTVTTTNLTYVNPALAGMSISSTLQLFPATQNSFSPPTTVEGFVVDKVNESLFQADSNQAFIVARVPEPASLLIVGTALAGLGFVSRRRNKKA